MSDKKTNPNKPDSEAVMRHEPGLDTEDSEKGNPTRWRHRVTGQSHATMGPPPPPPPPPTIDNDNDDDDKRNFGNPDRVRHKTLSFTDNPNSPTTKTRS